MFQMKKSFNNFSFEQCEKNYIIIKEADDPIFNYLIKSGEFEVSIKCSLIELNTIINYFGGVNLNEKEEEYYLMKNIINSLIKNIILR